MELSDTLMEELTGWTDKRMERPSRDRRTNARIPWRRQLPLISVEEGGLSGINYARTREVSSRGIGFLLSYPMSRGQCFYIGLPRKYGEAMWVQCVVSRKVAISSSLYMIGARFVQVMEEQPVSWRASA